MAVQTQILVTGTPAEIQAALALLQGAKRGPGRPKKSEEPKEDETEDEAEEDETEDEAEEDETEDEAEEDETEDEAEEAPAPKKLTQAKLFKAFQTYVEVNGRAKGHAVLKKFGVKAAKDIPEAKWPAVMKTLKS